MNAIGQRTGVATSGIAFPAVPSWLWSYDALGQVIAADNSVNTSDRAYQYDSIGNRQRAAAGTLDVNDPVATLYAASGLNQYSQITSNAITSTLVHDADGNATVYPGETTSQLVPQGEQRTVLEKSFSWNAENQMVFSKSCSKSQIISPVVPGGPAPINPVAIGSDTAQTYYFYDSLGRRIAKKSGTTDNGMTIYIYDGWNCIAEYTQHSEGNFLKITRLWGIDLSDNLQGAGGVGGMLSESSLITSNPITFNSFCPTYDGNGNVSEYLSANGTIAVHFEYDPFGNTVVNTDTSNQFACRFSTKSLDIETGLYYYGYRYYDPMTGRWPSRDPIKERGGVNLYSILSNDTVRRSDYHGLLDSKEAFDHFKGGTRNAKRMPFSDIDTSSDKPSQFPRVKDAIRNFKKNPKPARTVQIQWKNKSDNLPFSASGDQALLLGDISLKLEGDFVLKSDCTWEFKGDLKSFDDWYDLNASTHRGPIGELLTTFGRNTSAEPFDIEIRGSKQLTETGSMSTHQDLDGGGGGGWY